MEKLKQNILIIDNNQQTLEKIKIILEFLGENTILVDSSNNDCESVKLSDSYAVLIGEVKNCNWLKAQINVLDKSAKKCPIVYINEKQVTIDFLQHHVVGSLSWPLRYANVLDMLHRCHMVKEEELFQKSVSHNNSMYQDLVGMSSGMKDVRHLIEQVAGSDTTVLILGKSGTGKEVVAKKIHETSLRSKKPFVPVNCGAIPSELLESELFGHEKGAFTGAISSRSGRFELANSGTLF